MRSEESTIGCKVKRSHNGIVSVTSGLTSLPEAVGPDGCQICMYESIVYAPFDGIFGWWPLLSA